MAVWIGAPNCVHTGQSARLLLEKDNDYRFHSSEFGIIKINRNRWIKAQQYELNGWTKYWLDKNNDRADEHARLFNDYIDLPINLGSVCEVGCGPFTQLQTISRNRVLTEVTLIDPLIDHYRKLINCPYANGSFNDLPTKLITNILENFTNEKFDTVICINVIEHVRDAILALGNILKIIKSNGILIFGERSHDDFDPKEHFDVGHPIRLKTPILQEFKEKFNNSYHNDYYFIGTPA